MKGRSNRLPAPSVPSEDWGDGSWTVDCPCGVTFDDGEEMVDCDVCGVWVHTRCSRFIKGEASFACDKCKGGKSRLFSSSPGGIAEQNGGNQYNYNSSGSGAINTEETEVAQLLVELPTKTDPFPPMAPQRPPAVRVWTRAPIEERVHVQGVPGGDPSLFQGLSSVFTSELWKCTGYVPKKFNFKYKEFPSWEDDEESDIPANRGADLLFSLSKEVGPRGPLESYGQRTSSKVMKRGDGKGLGNSGGINCRFQASAKKDRNKIRVIGVDGKRKEENGAGKDHNSKKKSRNGNEKGVSDGRKRGSSPLAMTSKSGIREDSVSHYAKIDSLYTLAEDNRKDEISLRTRLSNDPETNEYDLKPKHVFVIKASSTAFSGEPLQSGFPTKAHTRAENAGGAQGYSRTQPKNGTSTASPGETSCSIKEEVSDVLIDMPRRTDMGENCLGGQKEDSSVILMKYETLKCGQGDKFNSPDPPDLCTVQDTVASVSSVKVKIEEEPVRDYAHISRAFTLPPAPEDDKAQCDQERSTANSERSTCIPPDDLQINNSHSIPQVPPPCKDKSLDSEVELKTKHSSLEALPDKPVSASGVLKHDGQGRRESLGPPAEGSSESICHLKPEEREKSGSISSDSFVPCDINQEPATENNSSNSSTPVFSKLSTLGMNKSCHISAPSAEKIVSKQRITTNSQNGGRKESTMAVFGEELTREVTRQSTKNHLSCSTSSVSKSSQSCKSPHYDPKHVLTVSKEHLQCASKGASRSEKIVKLSSFGESTSSHQRQKESIQVKAAISSSQKGEYIKQQISQTHSKDNNPMPVPPSINASTQLSDEELALLLHQELNSSPRVPRVPRIRQAGGFQLTGNAATSILSRRSSCSGGKDQASVSRRKNKEDGNRETLHNDDSKKINRFPSPDTRKEVLNSPIDPKRDGHGKSCETLSSSKKNSQLCFGTGANNDVSVPAEFDIENDSCVHNAPKNVLGEDSTQALTLPGLIDAIMSEGKCTTYEELCDQVLPHWNCLRKLNGERYAYSSHSQAVLDCLRNRNEWAHLIGRVPKTNSSRKKRKFVGGAVDSENEEASRELDDKSCDPDPHREDVPKGKRKARKRRLLALESRNLKLSKSRSQGALPDDDDSRSSSPSSNGAQSVYSDDDSQGISESLAAGDEPTTTSSDDDSD